MKKTTTKKKTKKKKSRKILKGIGIIFFFIILFMLSFGVFTYFSYKQAFADINKDASDKVASINKNTFRKAGPTIIYDSSGKEIGRLSDADYIYTKYNDIPELMRDAFIATEDKDFYKNDGISIKGISRAFVTAIKNKGKFTQGGSTITQQLVKNVLLTQDRTWQRKITEAIISLQLTKAYSKEQILEYYLNNIDFNNRAYSVASASKIYFNKSLDQLNLAEMTFLAAIPNSPTYYNPLKNYDHVITRQHLMLANLKSQKYISDAQYQEAMNTKVTLNYHPFQGSPDNFVTSYTVDCAARSLMEKNGFEFKNKFSSDQDEKDYKASYKEAYDDYSTKIRRGGYNIYTSFDLTKQDQLQKSLDNGLSGFSDVDKKTGIYKMQGAAVCVDNTTGEVIAAVGGRSQQDVTNYYNRAFLAVRQPGSSIKPLLVYAPAFDKGYNPEDTMIDQAIPNGPKNAEGTFFGQVTLRYATELSLNTVAYQMLAKEGVQYALPYLYKMDFAHISKQDDGPILGVGGFTNGVTPVEMAGGYSALARGGEYIQPTCVDKISGEDGVILYENPKSKTRIYKEDSAYKMTDVLKGVLTQTWATGYGLGLDNMPAAGKTGTTSDCKDGWFAGYTPYYTTVVWVGYDTPMATSSLYGATYPGHIWQSFMNKASAGLQSKDFDIPQSIQDALKAKADADAQAAISNADTAVSAYESLHIKSKADYNAVQTALQNAQNAVSKVSDDKKQPYIDRINTKTAALNQEKLVVEAASQNTNTNGATNTNNQNGTGTTTNNSTGSNNNNKTGNGTTTDNGQSQNSGTGH